MGNAVGICSQPDKNQESFDGPVDKDLKIKRSPKS